MSTENNSWAESIPVAQGLYNPEFEKDACGVGFMVHVKGHRSHKILSDASSIVSKKKEGYFMSNFIMFTNGFLFMFYCFYHSFAT
jgi:hypothetical protein